MMTRPAPAALRAAVARLGAQFNADVATATRDIYRDTLDLSAAAVERADLSYGLHARHRVDLYAPVNPRAVIVFVHGGGFVAGDKNADGAYYVNVGRWLARQGVVALLPNYRLAPADPWPAGARDVAAVVAQCNTLLDSAGLVPRPIFILGQSAGASHVASWLFDAAARGLPTRPDVAGVLLMSGFYDPRAPLPPGPRAYFGDDESLYPTRAPIGHVADPGLPMWLSLAELDPPWIAAQTYALAAALTAVSARGPQFHWYEGHNHVSTVQSLGSPQTDGGEPMLGFIDAVLKRLQPERA